jgi:dCMP deaminase
MRNRPDWNAYFLEIALVVAKRATCIRRCYGAVIVKNNRIISTGYCGAPRGVSNCIDGDGECARNKMGFGPGEGYDHCVSVHAEQNAIINADTEKMEGATIYVAGFDSVTGKLVSGEPCKICKRFIKNALIENVVTT